MRIVIDAGLERRSLFDPSSGMNRLEVQRIARSSAEQRKGRAGRTAPGHTSIAVARGAHRRSRWDLLGISASADTSVAPVELDLDALSTVVPRAQKKAAAVVEEEPEYRLRFVADFEGYRIVALLEESTQQMEITDGPMQGRRFENPTVAASAVASFVSGDVEKRDGATFWRAEAI